MGQGLASEGAGNGAPTRILTWVRLRCHFSLGKAGLYMEGSSHSASCGRSFSITWQDREKSWNRVLGLPFPRPPGLSNLCPVPSSHPVSLAHLAQDEGHHVS